KLKPVWHVREPEHWLERYLEEGHDYIFIGGMVPETNSWLLERLDDVFNRVLTDDEGRPRAKYHGFGVTAWSLLFRYPWYSVDSTAYLIRAAYGMVVAPMGDRFVDITISSESPRRFDKNSWHVRNLTPR
nr:hypothetical protein [Methylotetracoccus sp.]